MRRGRRSTASRCLLGHGSIERGDNPALRAPVFRTLRSFRTHHEEAHVGLPLIDIAS